MKKTYYEKNKEKILRKKKENYYKNRESKIQYSRDYYNKNKDKILSDPEYKEKARIRSKKYRDENREKYLLSKKLIREKNKDKISIYNKQYREANKNYFKNYNYNYKKNRKKEDIDFRIICNLRSRLSNIVKRKSNSLSVKKLLGCNFKTLKSHLENKFTEGMNWDNYGEWHLDHIIPISSGSSEEDYKKLCHYTNLQPLWAVDNIRKKDNIL